MNTWIEDNIALLIFLDLYLYDIGVEWRNASASQARGPRFESLREHSSFSLKSPDFVPVAFMEAFPGMGQARIESNLFIY